MNVTNTIPVQRGARSSHIARRDIFSCSKSLDATVELKRSVRTKNWKLPLHRGEGAGRVRVYRIEIIVLYVIL